MHEIASLFEEFAPGQFQAGDHRNRILLDESRRQAQRFELFRRCPDFWSYWETVRKLKMVFPRGAVDPRGRRGAQFGFDIVDWLEALYLVAKHSSFGRDTDDPHFSDGLRRRTPGHPGGSAA